MTDVDNAASGLSRRTLVKTAAWSVPVLAAATAAPAYAASLPVATAASITVTPTNPTAGTNVSFTVTGQAPDGHGGYTSATIPAGETISFTFAGAAKATGATLTGLNLVQGNPVNGGTVVYATTGPLTSVQATFIGVGPSGSIGTTVLGGTGTATIVPLTATAATITPTPASPVAYGTDISFSIQGTLNGQPAPLAAGTVVTVSGVGAASYSAPGLTLDSGTAAAGNLQFHVTSTTAGPITVSLTNLAVAGGTLAVTALGTTQNVTVIPLATSVIWSFPTGTSVPTGGTAQFTAQGRRGAAVAIIPAGQAFTLTLGGSGSNRPTVGSPSGLTGSGTSYTVTSATSGNVGVTVTFGKKAETAVATILSTPSPTVTSA